MAKYRKKPIVIEAFRMGIDPRPDWFTEEMIKGRIETYYVDYTPTDSDPTPVTDPFEFRETYCTIQTLEGLMRGDYGDFIIRGVEGEIYPCKPDIFEKTYEEVAE